VTGRGALARLGRDGLLERERELAALEAALDAAGAGRGGVVVIEGAAGIGKTRLLGAARAGAAARGMAVFCARGSDLESKFAYGVVRQLFEHAVAREGDALLFGVASHAASVFITRELSRERPPAIPSPAALEHGLFWLVANLAERGSLLVAVGDAQWADEASLRFLHYLARRVDELGVALVLASRRAGSGVRSELAARITAEPATRVLPVRVLSAAAASELVRALVSRDADERFCGACYAATGGNPLLLRELAGALAADGVPADRSEPGRVERLVPDAVARHVLVRLARRPPAAAALARAAAVLGDGAEPRHAAALAGLDESAAVEAADALVAADVLRPHRPLVSADVGERVSRSISIRSGLKSGRSPKRCSLAYGRSARDGGVPVPRPCSSRPVLGSGGSLWPFRGGHRLE
jgi:predicted ATPase